MLVRMGGRDFVSVINPEESVTILRQLLLAQGRQDLASVPFLDSSELPTIRSLTLASPSGAGLHWRFFLDSLGESGIHS